jgi:hypothetical protein
MLQAYKQMFAKSTLNRVIWTAKARTNTFLAAPGSQPPKGWVVLWGRALSGWALLALGQTLQRWAVLPSEPSTSDLDPTPTSRTPTTGPVPTPLPGQLARHRPDANTSHTDTRPRTDSPSRPTRKTWARRQHAAPRHPGQEPTPPPWLLTRRRSDATQSDTKAPCRRPNVFLHLVPVVSGVVALFLSGEPFGPLELAGAALALSGLVLASAGASNLRRPAPRRRRNRSDPDRSPLRTRYHGLATTVPNLRTFRSGPLPMVRPSTSAAQGPNISSPPGYVR